LQREELTEGTLADLAGRLADFHRRAERGPMKVGLFGSYLAVAENALDNLDGIAAQSGETIHPDVWKRVIESFLAELPRQRPLMEARAARGVPCDTHGDLHLDHVYHFPDRPPPRDLLPIDCVEFNDAFRYADPISDMAFLAMDLRFR